MELFVRLLPSIVVLSVIAGIGKLYFWLINKFLHDQVNSAEWIQSHGLFTTLCLGFPLQIIVGPAIEELCFRTPTILLAGYFPSFKWAFILLSTTVFACAHWFGKKLLVEELVASDARSKHSIDNLDDLGEIVEFEKRNEIIKRKFLHVLFAFFPGFLLSYFGVKYQSLWISYGLHAVWNLIAPLGVVLILLLFKIVTSFFIGLGHRRRLKRIFSDRRPRRFRMNHE